MIKFNYHPDPRTDLLYLHHRVKNSSELQRFTPTSAERSSLTVLIRLGQVFQSGLLFMSFSFCTRILCGFSSLKQFLYYIFFSPFIYCIQFEEHFDSCGTWEQQNMLASLSRLFWPFTVILFELQ